MRSAALGAFAHDIGRSLGAFARRACAAGAAGSTVVAGATTAVPGTAAVSGTIARATITAAARATATVAVGGTGFARPNWTGRGETPLGALRDVEVCEEVWRRRFC